MPTPSPRSVRIPSIMVAGETSDRTPVEVTVLASDLVPQTVRTTTNRGSSRLIRFLGAWRLDNANLGEVSVIESLALLPHTMGGYRKGFKVTGPSPAPRI